MSEQVKKINFSALKTNNAELNKSSEKVTSPPKEVNEITGTWDKTKIQVSLWKKKDILKKDEPIKIEVNKEEKKEESVKIEINENKNSNIKTDIIKAEEKVQKTENKIIVPNKIENSDKKLEIENKVEEVKIWNETLLKDPENLFNNYESDFTVKQDSIIDKIKKLKDLPKTRPALVFWMLWFLIIWVSWLVFISPDDSYLKASVLWVEQVKEQKITEPVNNINNKDVENVKIDKEKRKKEKLENFLLNKKNKPNKLPENIKKNIKNKSKEEKLKEMLLNAKKTK